jgi:uncharacterized membrane protein
MFERSQHGKTEVNAGRIMQFLAAFIFSKQEGVFSRDIRVSSDNITIM